MHMSLASDVLRDHRHTGEAVTYVGFGVGSYLLFR